MSAVYYCMKMDARVETINGHKKDLHKQPDNEMLVYYS